MITRLCWGVVLTLAIAGATRGSAAPAPQQTLSPIDSAAAGIFNAAYNLNYDEALRRARQMVASSPDESLAHRTLATVVWMHLLFDRGASSIDHYLSGLTSSTIQLPPPPPERAAEFRRHVDRAIALAETRVRQRQADVSARYDLGVAHGLLASYIATIEGKVTQAFGSAKRAFDAHEEVLARAPDRLEAGLVVGTYRYAIAALSMPRRLLAYLAGFGGGKERGVSMVEEATHRELTRTDARIALVLMYSREGRHLEALALLKALATAYPENRLLQLEAGSAALRAGRAAESENLLTAGLAWHDRDPRPKIPGERALWLYKRGITRVSLYRLDGAVTDLRLALTHEPTGWVRGRIHLELGKVADLRGQRADALLEYRRSSDLCRTHRDPWCSEQAALLTKRPFRFPTDPVD